MFFGRVNDGRANDGRVNEGRSVERVWKVNKRRQTLLRPLSPEAHPEELRASR